jgi:hypothetical protein
MAATVSLKSLLRILAKSITNLSDNDALALEKLARDNFSGAAQLAATGTQEVTLCQKTKAPLRILEGSFAVLATSAADANSRDAQLKYDDGAGGTAVALSSLYDGTAVAMTQDVRNALTITAGVIVPTGSRIYIESTANGCGFALDIMADVLVEYE